MTGPILVPTPDPLTSRTVNVAEIARLQLPVPPAKFPLVWEPGDTVALRTVPELEARTAILCVVLARAFGMPADLATGWLREARLMDLVTPPEWEFLAGSAGNDHSFALHLEAISALVWLLGLTKTLDPAAPGAENITALLPDLRGRESFAAWRARSLVAPREPAAAAAVLDLYYCLDWAYLEAERRGRPLPGLIDSNSIGQRRWALEWAVVFFGPSHDAPRGWEEIDLST